MTFDFALCPSCQARYQSLRLDSRSQYDVGPKPFYSLVWHDEHPDRSGYFTSCCIACQESILLLAYARTHFWRHGELPSALVDLWGKAQLTLPDWPGFKRLSLSENQKKDLDACSEPPAGVMNPGTVNPGGFVQYMEQRSRNDVELVRPGSYLKLGLEGPEKSVIRCPRCNEFVDSSQKVCRFCSAELKPGDIDSAVARRVQEKAVANQKEMGRKKVSGWLSLAAIGIYFFVPAAQPTAHVIKLVVAFLLIGLSLANRAR